MAEDITHPFNDVPDSGILAKNEIDVADRVMSKTTQKPGNELSVLLGLEDAPTAVAPPPVAQIPEPDVTESVEPPPATEETLSKKFF